MAAKSFAEGYVKGYLSEIKKYVEDGSLSLQKVLTDLGITEKRFLELTSPEKE